MNLVDEEHVARFQRGQYAGQVAGLVEYGATGNLEAHAQLVGNDVAQCGLAKSRGAVQQGMVERFATVLGSLDKHFEVLHHLLLTAEVAEAQWAQRVLEVLLGLRHPFLPYVKIFFHYSIVIFKK